MALETGGFEGTGYTPDSLDDLIARMEAIPETEVEPFGGGYTEGEREGIAGVGPGNAMREITLLFTAEQYGEFVGWVELLAGHFETSGTVATVYAAVEAEVAAHT